MQMMRIERWVYRATSALRLCGWLVMLLGAGRDVLAQDHIVPFDVSEAGVSKAITNWGLDTCWANFDNMQRGLIYIGTNHVNLVRVGFLVDAPLTNNDLAASQKATLQNMKNLANMATAATKWDLNVASDVNGWFKPDTNTWADTVYPDRWAAAMLAAQRYYNRSFWMAEGFNEPDYGYGQSWGWGEGSQQNLYDIFGYLLASTNFPGALFGAGSTLGTDDAVSWFNAASPRATAGTVHCLSGSAANYVAFLQRVAASNAVPVNPELHNVVEAILGANYGLRGGIWWGSAELARGGFVRACKGTRLGYSDDWGKWTAAAVYRGTNNAVQAFVGESERQALPTTYRFFSKDRDVFYDGDGPRRDYTVTTTGGPGYQTEAHRNAERVVEIQWGDEVPPLINGRYLIVNRNSGKVLQVPNSSTANGVQLTQNTYTSGLNQQWDVNPLPKTFGGDYSYFTIKAAHSGVTADLNNWSYGNGAAIQQWNGGTNTLEQWYFQYTTNGWIKIRNRWSNKVMAVNGAATVNGAVILQWDDTGSLDQQWRLLPVGATPFDVTNRIALASPAGVTAIASAVSVQLNWSASTATNFASYTVLRSATSGGPYDIVARGLTTTSFTDKSANQPKNYFYVVRTVDKSLNAATNSLPAVARPSGGKALVARYSFDGNLSDASGNANHPIVTNGTPAFAPGKFGSALTNDGSSQSLLLPANLLAGVTNFTFAAWVYWNGGGAWQRVFDFGNDTTQYLFLTPSSGSGTLRFAITTNSGGGEQMVETAALSTGTWQHVAVTRNGNTLKLYKSGSPVATNLNATIAPAQFDPALNYLGKSQWPDPLFNGRLDEVQIYNYALTGTEIARLTNNLPPPPSVPTPLVVAGSGDTLNFSWPSNYLGCRLESNAVALVAANSWFPVTSDASTNRVFVPISTARTNVFFRLVYP